VILADMEKQEMEEELRNHNTDFLGSHVVCRLISAKLQHVQQQIGQGRPCSLQQDSVVQTH
jgi:hypothetical protein